MPGCYTYFFNVFKQCIQASSQLMKKQMTWYKRKNFSLFDIHVYKLQIISLILVVIMLMTGYSLMV